VVRCRGLGQPDEREAGRYRRFACVAGARRKGESYDTVAIRYVIRVRPAGGYVLENVRFSGLGFHDAGSDLSASENARYGRSYSS
jgi:hypothetical protein